MKLINYFLLLSILLFYVLILGCNQSKSEDKSMGENAQVQETAEKADEMPGLDPELDPLKVGTEFSNVLSDTLNVQLYEMTMEPGDSVGLHQHLDHVVYVLEGGTLMVYINGTDPVEMNLPAGAGFVAGPLNDAARNTGETTVKLLITEIHRPRE